jgi:predicted nuclease of predicted toxin-antitoxin system
VRILFDQGTPAPLRKFLPGHEIATAHERGWGNLQNGDLLRMAEVSGFDTVITTDQNLRYQQNLPERRLAIIVLLTTNWPQIRPHASLVASAVVRLAPNAYVELTFPPQPDGKQL